MTINQLTVFIENNQGSLAEITKVFHDHNINMKALSLADTASFGVLRLIVDHFEEASIALRDAGFTVSTTKVLAICISNKPGGLYRILATLDNEKVSVEYMYAFTSPMKDSAYVILRPDDTIKAIEVIKRNNISILTHDDLI